MEPGSFALPPTQQPPRLRVWNSQWVRRREDRPRDGVKVRTSPLLAHPVARPEPTDGKGNAASSLSCGRKPRRRPEIALLVGVRAVSPPPPRCRSASPTACQACASAAPEPAPAATQRSPPTEPPETPDVVNASASSGSTGSRFSPSIDGKSQSDTETSPLNKGLPIDLLGETNAVSSPTATARACSLTPRPPVQRARNPTIRGLEHSQRTASGGSAFEESKNGDDYGRVCDRRQTVA